MQRRAFLQSPRRRLRTAAPVDPYAVALSRVAAYSINFLGLTAAFMIPSSFLYRRYMARQEEFEARMTKELDDFRRR